MARACLLHVCPEIYDLLFAKSQVCDGCVNYLVSSPASGSAFRCEIDPFCHYQPLKKYHPEYHSPLTCLPHKSFIILELAEGFEPPTL